eukprot:5698979-Pyramimonas_sp.AAC.1
MHLSCARHPSSTEATADKSVDLSGCIMDMACTNMSVAHTPGVHASAFTGLPLRLSLWSAAQVKSRFASLL